MLISSFLATIVATGRKVYRRFEFAGGKNRKVRIHPTVIRSEVGGVMERR